MTEDHIRVKYTSGGNYLTHHDEREMLRDELRINGKSFGLREEQTTAYLPYDEVEETEEAIEVTIKDD